MRSSTFQRKSNFSNNEYQIVPDYRPFGKDFRLMACVSIQCRIGLSSPMPPGFINQRGHFCWIGLDKDSQPPRLHGGREGVGGYADNLAVGMHRDRHFGRHTDR